MDVGARMAFGVEGHLLLEDPLLRVLGVVE
jgi:hypothetical protein